MAIFAYIHREGGVFLKMCLRNICMVHQHFGLIPGCGYPTGIFLFIVLSAMYIFSMKYVRTGGYFEVHTYNKRAIISLENHLKTFFVPFFQVILLQSLTLRVVLDFIAFSLTKFLDLVHSTLFHILFGKNISYGKNV